MEPLQHLTSREHLRMVTKGTKPQLALYEAAADLGYLFLIPPWCQHRNSLKTCCPWLLERITLSELQTVEQEICPQKSWLCYDPPTLRALASHLPV